MEKATQTEIPGQNLKLVPIHNHPEYLKPCCALINGEWPRSESARMQSLQASRDDLPTSLILLMEGDVVGHCKLSRIPAVPEGTFAESVVIKKELRGRKLGTYLMIKVEEYCREVLHLNKLYLSTEAQQIFYEKLGYVECAPVSIYGGFVASTSSIIIPPLTPPQAAVQSGITNSDNRKVVGGTTAVPPPPPPPPPPLLNATSRDVMTQTRKTYMVKNL